MYSLLKLLVYVIHGLPEVNGQRGVVVVEETNEQILWYQSSLEVPDWPQPDKDKMKIINKKIFVVQPVQRVLPLRDPEVDGVKVGHHEGRLEEIVETDYHGQDHVGNIDISEKLHLSTPGSL